MMFEISKPGEGPRLFEISAVRGEPAGLMVHEVSTESPKTQDDVLSTADRAPMAPLAEGAWFDPDDIIKEMTDVIDKWYFIGGSMQATVTF